MNKNIYVVVTEDCFGSTLWSSKPKQIFEKESEAIDYQNKIDLDSILISFYIKDEKYITFSELCYGGYEKNHIKIFNNKEEASKFVEDIGEKDNVEFIIEDIN